VSAKTRIWLVVGAVALAAAGGTVGATLLTRTEPPSSSSALPTKQKGPPELDIDLGVRTDPQATALRRALQLYDKGQTKKAGAIFSRYGSLEAEIGASLAGWPDGFDRLAALAREHPASSLAQLELGLAFFWQNRIAQAESAWKQAAKLQPDTSYAVRAGDFLHPRDAPGLPPFSPSFDAPRQLAGLTSPQQFAFLREQARTRGVHAMLLYGAALQKLGRPLSARREFLAAAALAPNDPDAQVAAAVGLFDKARPVVSFSRLGPLVKRFSHAVTVRFHLGLLLLWIGQLQAARAQLDKVVGSGPSPFLADTRLLLAKLPRK
jgi:tetratricopeptide (TPR) repeat protein